MYVLKLGDVLFRFTVLFHVFGDCLHKILAQVYLMAKKRHMDTMRNNLLRLYEFDSNEQEWESLNSYDNPTRINYNTTNF